MARYRNTLHALAKRKTKEPLGVEERYVLAIHDHLLALTWRRRWISCCSISKPARKIG
jgi:hypothetical protein